MVTGSPPPRPPPARPQLVKRWVLMLAGLALCSGAIVALCYAIYALGRTGTCASGGPYVTARPCPPGTGTDIMLIFAGVIGGLIGIGLYIAGSKERASSAIGLGVLMWCFLFVGIAGSLAFAAWGPAANAEDPGVELAAIILLVIFIPMGVAPLLIAGAAARAKKPLREAARKAGQDPAIAGVGSLSSATATPRPALPSGTPPGPPPGPPPRRPPPPPRPGTGGGDVVSRLERLDTLRRSGAVTPEEFERLKRDILEDV